jgi:hypothetical protein
MTRLLLNAYNGTWIATRARYANGECVSFEAYTYQQPGGWKRVDEKHPFSVVVDGTGCMARVELRRHISSWRVVRGFAVREFYARVGDPFAEGEPYTATDAHLDEGAAVDRADRAERRREFSGVDNDRGEP